MQYRLNAWVDLQKEAPAWGIDARRSRLDAWTHCVDGSKPVIFYNKEDAVAKLRELREAALQDDKE